MKYYTQLFKQLRKDLGLNQIEMAKILGITQGWVSRVEAGKSYPCVETFIRANKIIKKHYPATCLSNTMVEKIINST